jgi:hypothetical protein
MVTSERPRIQAPTVRSQGFGALIGGCYALVAIGVVGGVVLLLNGIWPWLAWGYVGVSLAVGIPGAIAESARRRHHSHR